MNVFIPFRPVLWIAWLSRHTQKSGREMMWMWVLCTIIQHVCTLLYINSVYDSWDQHDLFYFFSSDTQTSSLPNKRWVAWFNCHNATEHSLLNNSINIYKYPESISAWISSLEDCINVSLAFYLIHFYREELASKVPLSQWSCLTPEENPTFSI